MKEDDKMQLLISGYTHHTSKGIYELPVIKNQKEIHVGAAKNIAQVGSPTYLQVDGSLIFAINRADGKGGINSYRQVKDGQPLQLIDTFLETGTSPAYIGINRNHKLLYIANYHTAVISILNYDAAGHLHLLTETKEKADHLGPLPEQKDGAHPHFFDQTPAGNLVCCDLGNDRVDFYKLQANKLQLLARYQSEAGFGNRHLVFAPNAPYFYVAGELASKVSVVKYNEKSWQFETINTYLTKPAGWHQHNGAAAIRLSSDGRFLYISNRGHNSIAVFKVKADHTLTLVQRISTFGDFPRDFNWDPSQKYVVAANQNSNNATLYSRNAVTGALTPLQKDIKVPEGTCVAFIK